MAQTAARFLQAYILDRKSERIWHSSMRSSSIDPYDMRPRHVMRAADTASWSSDSLESIMP